MKCFSSLHSKNEPTKYCDCLTLYFSNPLFLYSNLLSCSIKNTNTSDNDHPIWFPVSLPLLLLVHVKFSPSFSLSSTLFSPFGFLI